MGNIAFFCALEPIWGMIEWDDGEDLVRAIRNGELLHTQDLRSFTEESPDPRHYKTFQRDASQLPPTAR